MTIAACILYGLGCLSLGIGIGTKDDIDSDLAPLFGGAGLAMLISTGVMHIVHACVT